MSSCTLIPTYLSHLDVYVVDIKSMKARNDLRLILLINSQSSLKLIRLLATYYIIPNHPLDNYTTSYNLYNFKLSHANMKQLHESCSFLSILLKNIFQRTDRS